MFDIGDLVIGKSKRIVKAVSIKDNYLFVGKIINEDEVDESIYAKGGVGMEYELYIKHYALLKKGDVEFEF